MEIIRKEIERLINKYDSTLAAHERMFENNNSKYLEGNMEVEYEVRLDLKRLLENFKNN